MRNLSVRLVCFRRSVGIAPNYWIHATNVRSMLIVTHGIKNLPNHYFSGNDLWVMTNFNKRMQYRKQLKMQVKKSKGIECKGYYIDRKFRSLSSLKKRTYPLTYVEVQKEYLPF
jgi:hypothetical protein